MTGTVAIGRTDRRVKKVLVMEKFKRVDGKVKKKSMYIEKAKGRIVTGRGTKGRKGLSQRE